MLDVISERRYGEPRLKKPPELKGLKPFYTHKYSGKSACPAFIHGADIWVKHTDWCSTELYGVERKERRFVYLDTWGAVVLRGHAWIRMTGILLYDSRYEAVRQITYDCLIAEGSRFCTDDERMLTSIYVQAADVNKMQYGK